MVQVGICFRMVQALKKPHTTMKRQALVHTGIVVPDYKGGAVNITGWTDTIRKLRLLPLSFLASQDLQRPGLQTQVFCFCESTSAESFLLN